MGIKNLNRFLRDNCKKKSIYKASLKDLRGKTIVIDTSIYLYKFLGENALMENMYLFISTLLDNGITPIFIFDGKPPPEKREILLERRLGKKEAENKYVILQNKLKDPGGTPISDEDRTEILTEMDQLKRQFIRLRDDDIRKAKELIRAYGVEQYDAHGEADALCAYFVISGRAWACLSDDMDMFLYGCNFIIRHLSLLKQTVVVYNRNCILNDLEMSDRHFREIMVLSGTDYNTKSKTTLNESIDWFYKYNNYKKLFESTELKPLEFYVWLVKNTNYVDNYLKLLKTYQMFQLKNANQYAHLIQETPEPTMLNISLVQEIMRKEGFVFAS